MNRQYIPLVFVLLSGAITCIITFTSDYPLLTKLIILFAVMLIFFVLGAILESFLDHFEQDIKAKEEALRLEKEKEELEQKEREEQEAREREERERASQ